MKRHELRPATDRDYDYLYRLFVDTMQSSIAALWGGWEEARWSAFFRAHFDSARYQVVMLGGQPVGALAVERRPHEIYLDTVEIAPAHQGQGLGTALIREVLREAGALGLPVTLQVNRVNPSKRLYERLGFIETGSTDTHYLLRAAPGRETPAASRLTVERNTPVRMRDGTILYADTYRPDGAERLPVLLQRTAYDKATSAVVEALRFAGAGYVVVVQDVRGRFASEGEFHPFAHEGEDGYDAVEWCAAQPWSDGRVGMFGASYTGVTQWLAALARPPHLATIIPAFTAADFRDGWIYPGGAFSLGFALSWSLGLAAETARRLGAEGPDSVERRVRLRAALDRLPERLKHLPLDDQPALDGLAPYFFDWLRRSPEDVRWDRWAMAQRYREITIPVFHVGGWYDIFLSGTLRDFEGIRSGGANREKGQVLIGPWSHGLPWMANPVGSVDFGAASEGAAIDYTGLQLAWFDRRLKGRGPDDDSPVRIFVMGENRWRDECEWPPARAEYREFFLHSGGAANALSGDGRLGADRPGDEPCDSFLYKHADPVPTHGGGLCCSPVHLPGGAFDQSAIEARPDVLVYSSAALHVDLEVTGPIRLRLWAATSAAGADWTAKLVDVSPDGYARNLTDGIIRAIDRTSAPNQVREYAIDLGATSNTFMAGHRIRLEIGSSNFPRFDRNPNTGGAGAPPDTALQRIVHDADHPSRVILPVVSPI